MAPQPLHPFRMSAKIGQWGILTLATGSWHYRQMALDLALSVREHCALPISVVVDGNRLSAFRERWSWLFDRILTVPADAARRNLGKLSTAVLTPYDTTLYIDADCLVQADICDLLVAADASTSGYMMQAQWLSPAQHVGHNGFDSASLCRQFSLPRYLKSNSGLMAFRKNEGIQMQGQALMRRAAFSFWHRRVWMSDEVLLGIMADEFKVDLFPEPLPMAWKIGDVDPSDCRYKIVHAIGRPTWRHYRWLLRQVSGRRKQHQIPALPGHLAWSRKLLKV
jgi:hypothetical protein